MRFTTLTASLLLCASGTLARPASYDLVERQSTPKVVTAHFMLGIVSQYTAANWQEDINNAKDMGIDAFALNMANLATDPWYNTQLSLAYQQAQNLGFKLYISFDFHYFAENSGSVAEIVNVLNTYANHPAALRRNGKAVVTTFFGNGFGNNWNTVRSQVTTPLEILPNWWPSNVGSSAIDGAFSWHAWPSSNNQPIPGPLTTSEDNAYLSALGSKAYMAPISPWFSTHFMPQTSGFDKNWIFHSDDLFHTRWGQILTMAPPLIQIVTWNDFGESSYIGTYNPGHSDDGSSAWAAGFPHDAWRTLSKPYVAAYKAGASSPTVSADKLVYWYRPHSKTLTCSGPGEVKPNGWNLAADDVFVAAMLTAPADLIVKSGNNAPVSFSLPAGITLRQVPFTTGTQNFKIRRNGCDIISGNGGRQIDGSCTIYNFNVYVGELSTSGTCTTATTTTTTTSRTTTTTSHSPTPTSQTVCNHGQGEGNFMGLCDFSCYFGYCPPGVCTCTSWGAPNTPPPQTGQNGVPLPGLGDGYAGLCSFACNHGYCPSTACQIV